MLQISENDFSGLHSKKLYLDLLKRAVLAVLYEESEWFIMGSRPDTQSSVLKRTLKSTILRVVHKAGFLLVKPDPLTREALESRLTGGGGGAFRHTMVSMHRLDNIQNCIEQVLRDEIPGDLIETGAWRGGSTIFMRGVLAAYGVSDRKVFVADSFEGFPSISAAEAEYQADAEVDVASFNEGGPLSMWLSVPMERVQKTFARYGLLDDKVVFLKGWFSDTLPNAPIEQLSILRLDGDLYKSTMDALEALYHKVSLGGFIIVDDYNCWPHCKAAVDTFRARLGITDPMEEIDHHSVFWRKSN